MTERILTIGLDSASLPWVMKWVKEGRLPNIGRALNSGASGILRTVMPPLSPAAWSAFATGMMPGKHGVFDHINRREGAYSIVPTSSKTRGGTPFWKILSKEGKRVGVVNIPETYPPEPLNGFMLSGMDTPSDDSPFSFPAGLKSELEEAVGGYKVFGMRSKESLDRSIEGMYQTIPMRVRAGQYLWDKYSPDYMALVFMETDVIQHKCWKYMDPSHPEYSKTTAAERKQYGDTIANIYACIDQALGPWLNSLDEKTTLIIMSDHGAGPLLKFLHMNNWLAREGYLVFKRSPVSMGKYGIYRAGFTPENMFNLASRLRLGFVDRATNTIKSEMAGKDRTTLFQRIFLSWDDIDWSRTKAYALGGNFTGFYVNLEGREPQGSVRPGDEYEALRKELANRLKTWADPDTGEVIVDQVFRREELYQGPYLERAPDVVFTTKNENYVGFGGHEFANNRLMNRSKLFNGHHRMDGMVIFNGPGVRPGTLGTHHIVDMAPTILRLLDCPVPANMDGRPIEAAFTDRFLNTHPLQSGEVLAEQERVQYVGDAQEEEQVKARLKELGYL
jgi:predicted AlkP superfamily phosphohydrolase/phosphomutase